MRWRYDAPKHLDLGDAEIETTPGTHGPRQLPGLSPASAPLQLPVVSLGVMGRGLGLFFYLVKSSILLFSLCIYV